ncbi:asparagine synthase (glutamine-hydrolyzing) [Roseivirga sp. BDSF3-8]|uniref:asparagine synthase (glutamine-hydrolyzing) n=1 Tax=Roseivirga sp. BDSF3-8 TaxID=3241598 RepID=UPI003531C175
MCGITGIRAFNEVGRVHMINLSSATRELSSRGPDDQGLFDTYYVGLGHRRLSIIDTSHDGHQPMSDISGRYTIVFNGEIFNYRELRKDLENKGQAFQSHTDTEVLLYLYINEGRGCLDRLNGFFAFAIHDKSDDSLFIARDRMGIKPLYYYADEDKVVFASEIKSLLAYHIPRSIDFESLYHYLQLNYIPSPHTILKDVYKLEPGHYLTIGGREIASERYYTVPYGGERTNTERSYEACQRELVNLLEDSVCKRLVADVPLGAFLSGGIDSSAIVSLASRHVQGLNTFSIGYRDEPFFDETKYAKLVADKFRTEHTVFSLTNNDLYAHLHGVLDYLDEPFADSSALPVYILSRETRKIATVALSGDGADELFSGYNKHMAFYRAAKGGLAPDLIKALLPLWKLMPQSRQGKLTNRVRQLRRFAEGMKLPADTRYWRWAIFTEEGEAMNMLSEESKGHLNRDEALQRQKKLLQHIKKGRDINEILYTDVHLVLPDDMLVKVDRMSMANSLEVRVPFLDHRVVEYAFGLPESYKIGAGMKKRILQDAFRDILPAELYKRPKHGFEVPLLKWFRGELRGMIDNDLLGDDFIADQGIFNTEAIQGMKKQLYSANPGDIHARVWGMIVFQYWYKKYFK